MSSGASAAELPAIVHKPAVDVHAQPAFDAPKLATLQRDTAVTISAQQGLWYQLRVPADATGYVRVNDVRLAYAGVEDGAANVRVLMGGKAGQGRVTETAGVRGIDESDLKAAAFDRTQLDAMVAQRVDGSAAAAYAGEHGWQATSVAYAGEAKRGKSGGKAPRNPRRRWPRPPRPSAACSARSAARWARCSEAPRRRCRSPRTNWPRRNSRSARRSPVASSAPVRCGAMPMRNGASTWSDAGSPHRPVARTCRGRSA